jgi:glycosyltransferase involved in cell wall biosynthesis
LPNVLKEAMSVGVPVVTTSLAGVAELVTHEESGLLVPAGDTEALAQALRRLLEDGGLRGRLAGHARKVMEERFDLRRNLARLRELLLDAIADAREVPAPLHATQTPHPIQQL